MNGESWVAANRIHPRGKLAGGLAEGKSWVAANRIHDHHGKLEVWKSVRECFRSAEKRAESRSARTPFCGPQGDHATAIDSSVLNDTDCT